MRRLFVSLALTAAVLMAGAAPAAADPISKGECYVGGGEPIPDINSPTFYTCRGGEYDGEPVEDEW